MSHDLDSEFLTSVKILAVSDTTEFFTAGMSKGNSCLGAARGGKGNKGNASGGGGAGKVAKLVDITALRTK